MSRPKLDRFVAPFALAALFAASPLTAQAATWELDGSHSRFGFSVRHLMVSNVHGVFKKASGTFEIDDKDPTKSKVEISVDVDSINTDEAKRDEHLRSADFFDAAKHPKLTFKSTKIAKTGKGYNVTGDLTIKGVTKPVTLVVDGPTKPVKDPWGNQKAGATATATINRKDFGLVWNMPLEGGGVVVGDEVKIAIDVELLAKK